MRTSVCVAARRGGSALLLLILSSIPSLANWSASGTFRYQDRPWGQNGFTGATTELPIRFADVEVIDPTKSRSKMILARGKTDANGAYTISVIDSSTRTVRVRLLAQTTQTPDLFVKVVDTVSGAVYAVRSVDYPNHDPNTNTNFGVLVATVGAGGEPFNVFEQGVSGADFIKFLTGSRPDSQKLVTFKWAINAGVTGSSTAGNTVNLRDTAGYDDTPILHEWSHYVMNNYSKSSNPGGSHYLSNCNEDLRLAFDEGRASFFGCSVRRHNGLSSANVYMRTDGGAGMGHVVASYDLEDELQYPCDGDTSEVSVSRSLWDIGDSASTTDTTPGVEEPHDLLALPDSETWQVFNVPIKNAGNGAFITEETFWDGWFSPTVANGYLNEMKTIFGFFTIEFSQDPFEGNNLVSAPTSITSNGSPLHMTYFYDPDGDGKGEADTDILRLDAVSGVSYTIETLNLLSDANTYLEVLDRNGITLLASNNDRSPGDPSSLITWTAPRTDIFYIRSKHASDYGIYGSYDVQVRNP